MSDPIKLQVLKALTTHLEGIVHVDGDPNNDWRGFNLAGCVFRGRSVYGDDDPKTMLSILEAPRPDNPTYGGVLNEASNETWTLLLQGWTVDEKKNPTDNAYLLDDVVTRRLQLITKTKPSTGTPVDPNSFLLGGLISNFSFGPSVVRPPTEGVSSKAFFYTQLRIGLASVVG